MTNSLINLGDLAKPVNTLVEKISDAIGGAVKPWQIKRIAKAEAEAETTKALAQFQFPELQRRAMHRLLHEETQRQLNIENVTAKALPLVKEQATPEDIEQDWLVNFFDKSKLVSDEQMQDVWGRILAGEANSPGTFSRFTINTLGNLEKHDAELFSKICSMCWMIMEPTPLIYNLNDGIFKQSGITLLALADLERLGLVHLGKMSGYEFDNAHETETLIYQDQKFEVTFPNGSTALNVGRVLLSRVGSDLFKVCTTAPNHDHLNYVLKKWEEMKYVVQQI